MVEVRRAVNPESPLRHCHCATEYRLNMSMSNPQNPQKWEKGEGLRLALAGGIDAVLSLIAEKEREGERERGSGENRNYVMEGIRF